MIEIVWNIVADGLFAAVAAVGFGAISDPPMRAFPRIALLAAVGHALRFTLMTYFSVDIATGSLCASLTIGFGSMLFAHRIHCPTTVRNGMITVFVILMLAAGATLPILMMPSKAYTMTRRRTYPSQQNND